MIEVVWKKLPRSERAIVGNIEADVWCFMTTKKVWKYTIIDNNNGHYLDCGICNTINEAKEKIDNFI